MITLILILSIWVYGVYSGNNEVCEEYFQEKCKGFSLLDQVCKCEGGEYELTSEMIQQRNKDLELLVNNTKRDAPQIPYYEDLSSLIVVNNAS